MKKATHCGVNSWNDWICMPILPQHLYNMHKEKTVVCTVRPCYNGGKEMIP